MYLEVSALHKQEWILHRYERVHVTWDMLTYL